VVNVKLFYLKRGTCKILNLKEFSFYAPHLDAGVSWCTCCPKKKWAGRPIECDDGIGYAKK
jgi:hypothetical protein